MAMNQSVPGLVLLRLIMNYYATSKHSEVVYSIRDLSSVQIKSGNVEGFQTSWDMILKGMKRSPDKETQEFLYYEAVKDFKGIAEDISHYERLEEGSGGDRSYEFLHESINRHIRIQRQQRMRKDITKALGNLSTTAPAAAGPRPET